MTEQEKHLLLVDLSARLPYGVKIFREIKDETGNTHTYEGYVLHELSNNGQHITLLNYDDKHGVCEVDIDCGEFKPYLRPMSSMTEEEVQEAEKINRLTYIDGKFANLRQFTLTNDRFVDWLNAHYLDYRGLIERGLALEAPKGMY